MVKKTKLHVSFGIKNNAQNICKIVSIVYDSFVRLANKIIDFLKSLEDVFESIFANKHSITFCGYLETRIR